MRQFLCVGFCLSLMFHAGQLMGQEQATAAKVDSDQVRQAVVKIYSIQKGYSLSSPWKRLTSKTVTGSGAVIARDKVLTNYHVVQFTTDVSISLDGQSERVSGEVIAIAPGLDLAVIQTEDPLPDSIVPLEVAEATPKAGSKIQVYGYPKGGETQSVTEGVVSRVEHVRYKYRTYGLRTQIDAPLNGGNSGGPMVSEGKIAGIAFSGLSASNDIGYAIPCEEINTALKDMEDGKYDGKFGFWGYTQTLASKELREYLKMPPGTTGMRFAMMPIPVEEYPLISNDVITHIGDFGVNNLGKVDLDATTQVSYIYAIDQSAKDGKVKMKILRDGEELEVQVPLFQDPHYLMDYLIEEPPTYFVYGPIVFGVATADYMSSLEGIMARGGSGANAVSRMMSLMQQRGSPYLMRRYDRVKDPNEELVLISKLISNRMTRSVNVPMPAAVRSINGIKITSIRQAAQLLNSLDEDKLVIEFEDNRDTKVVFDRKQVEREHETILEDNGIVRSASKDLRDVWDK